MSNLKLRILSSLILAPLVIIAVLSGEPWFTMLIASMGAFMGWEWDFMLNKKTTHLGTFLTSVAVMVAFLASSIPSVALGTILFSALFVYIKSKRNAFFTFGVFYVLVPVFSMIYMYYMNDKTSVDVILWILLVIWATDTGGYLVGKTLKGPKLCPRISPKKTWSGLLGCMSFAALMSYLFAFYIGLRGISPGALAGIGAVLAIVSQAGDFFESAIKRHLGIKDSSHLIPGHGGIFDRVDGLLFVAPVVALLLVLQNMGVL